MKRIFSASLIFSFLILFFTNCGKDGFDVTSPPLSVEDPPSALDDPLLDSQWHLKNTGQKVFATTAGTSGNDLNLQTTWSSGIYGSGITVLISDDGLESTHEDLKSNYLPGLYSKNYTKSAPYLAATSEPLATTDNHGTSVAGLIAAVGWNHRGGRGVAPKAQIACANFMSDNVARTIDRMVDQASGDYHIFNQSWGSTQDAVDEMDSTYKAQLLYGVTNYRGGKGSIYVKAAGNSFLLEVARNADKIELGNANFDSTNASPYTLNIAALAAIPIAASYSTPGANVWVAAPGGEDGASKPAMVTTDRTSCNLGYATSTSTLAFEKGTNNVFCKYNATFNGTSSAAPVASGAIALILEANPQLTWRDVKYILAKTATKIHASVPSFENPLYSSSPTTYADHKSPVGYVYEQSWITNGASFNFHNWYGFGRINVDAAVALAKTYVSTLGTYTNTNWNAAHKRSSLGLAIPDYNAAGVSDTLNVATNIKIEAVQLRLAITHTNIGTLAVELTSPAGTKSIVINMNNALEGLANYSNETLLINTFYQESTAGNWVLKAIDGRTGTTGTLTEWSLNFIGAP
ncbi:MAG: S8 family serine peptidase [Bdellovibrionota bacterium]